jgi:hypothetical protein
MAGPQDPELKREAKSRPASAGEIREELKLAKGRLTEQAGQLAWREYAVRHPYLSLGAAFFTGTLLGGSPEARANLSFVAATALAREILRRPKKS